MTAILYPLFSASLVEVKTERPPFCATGGQVAGGAEHPHRTRFQDAFKKLQKRCKWCILMEGDYFNGDGGQ
jgi:hypothetical protein